MLLVFPPPRAVQKEMGLRKGSREGKTGKMVDMGEYEEWP